MTNQVKENLEIISTILSGNGWKMGTAESCTGGGIAALLTDVPGASNWFAGGVVTYANDWKTNLLGVDEEVLKEFGAVSEETVEAMLDGLLERYSVQCGVAVSGIAGPDGGSEGKPVGTVFVGAALEQKRWVLRCQLSGTRAAVRKKAAEIAVKMMAAMLIDPLED